MFWKFLTYPKTFLDNLIISNFLLLLWDILQLYAMHFSERVFKNEEQFLGH